MKAFRKITAAAIALLLFASMSVPAYAADQGEDPGSLAPADATVIFGEEDSEFEFSPGSDYSATDLFVNFKGMLPGDTRTVLINLENRNADYDSIYFYLKAVEVTSNNVSQDVKSLSRGTPINELLSKMHLTVWCSGRMIYDASPDDPAQLSAMTPLGEIGKFRARQLRLELSMPIELGNEYAERIGEVQWIFHAEGYSGRRLTVSKVWSDGYNAHEDDVLKINLIRMESGKEPVIAETFELSSANLWTYTFKDLDDKYEWGVEELNVPEGYTVEYIRNSVSSITIYNLNDEGGEPLNLTVRKVWNSGDHEIPEYVYVNLYNGTRLYDQVRLDPSNNWCYKWEEEIIGNWRVEEASEQRNYYPTYTSVPEDNLIVITNSYDTIQTGQLKWPVAVFGTLGVLLIAGGIRLTRKKKTDA